VRVRTYRSAEKTLSHLRDRLRIAVAPREARRLKGLLVQLANENIAMAGVVAQLAAYLPALTRAQQPLGAAIEALRTGIKSSRSAHAQADTFAAYAAATSDIAARVSAVHAPALFVGARNAEADQLRRLSSLAGRIAEALRAKQVRQAQQLVASLDQEQGRLSVARAQRAAALAYNAQLAGIARTAKAIERERVRLERKVPAR
jgi:exonuclease VII small subunit